VLRPTYPNLVDKQAEVGLSWTGDSGRRAEIPGYNHGIANRKQTKESVETKPSEANEMGILAAFFAVRLTSDQT